MATDVEVRPLGELVVSFDCLREPVKESDRRSGPYPYYGASGIVDHVDGYRFDGDYLLIAEDGENLRTRQTPIAFMASGRFWVNNHAHVVQANETSDTRYLMYAVRVADVAAYLTGSTMPKLTAGNLGRIPVAYRDRSEQRAIASILGALDDKIELNRKVSATLEATARALFTSWFVDFDPVRAKVEGRTSGLPRELEALFASSLTASAMGDIPSGWRARPASEVIEVNPTRSLAGLERAPYVDMASVPTEGFAVSRVVERSVSSGSRFKNGDTLLARITPCLENGKTAFVDFLVDDQVAWGSTEFIVLRPRAPLPVEYGYLLARDSAFRKFLIGNMTGTSGRQRIPADALDSYIVVTPPESVATAFGDFVGPLFRRISAANRESQTLRAMRDTLLPRLISGELRVRDADRILEKSA